MNGHTKWVVGIVSAAIVALASWAVSNTLDKIEMLVTQQVLLQIQLTRVELKVEGVPKLETKVERLETTVNRMERRGRD